MLYLGLIAITTLAANGWRQLRFIAVGILAVSVVSDLIAAGLISPAQVAVSLAASLAAAAILFVAAGDPPYGEDPGWRLWVATVVAAAATPAAWASFRTAAAENSAIPVLGEDPAGVVAQVAAFWLIASGVAILLTAKGAVRSSLGALLMVDGVQLLVRLAPGPHLALTLLFAWLQVVIALTGAFLIVNERAAREL